MRNEKKYYLGKCDANGTGRKINKTFMTWEYNEEKGTFSACADVWNSKETDCIMAGQCLEEVAKHFRADKQAQSILKVWREWHLNNLTAGSPAQEAFLKSLPPWSWEQKEYKSHYDWASSELKKAGLNPDPDYLHNGKPYKYGHAWLKRELPADVVEAIKSWGES